MLIIPFVIEVTFSGHFAGRPWACIQHLVWDESSGTRTATDLQAIGVAVGSAFNGEIMDQMSALVSLENVKVQDLDNAGSFTVDVASTGVGALAGNASSPNVAVLATKVDGHTRGQRPGRVFFPGVVESDTDAAAPGNLTAAALGRWQASASAYRAGLSGTQSGSAYFPVVVHKGPSSPIPYNMTSLTINSHLATQRRRLRG